MLEDCKIGNSKFWACNCLSNSENKTNGLHTGIVLSSDFDIDMLRQTKKKHAVIIFVIITFAVWRYYSFDDFDSLSQLHDCIQYGDDLCRKASGIKVKKMAKHFFGLNAKNVYYAECAKCQEKDIVLKKLGHRKELRNYEQILVKNFGFCSNEQKSDGKIFHLLTTVIQKAFICEPSGRILEKLEKLKETTHIEVEDIIAILYINPEPVVVQLFPARKGFPFPKFVGACGKLVAEEFIPYPLSQYCNAHWKTRIQLSIQLLEHALKLSSTTDHFSLYLTDLTFDNIAVRDDGSVVIVDVEDIVIVDKLKDNVEKTLVHKVTDSDCGLHPGCLSFAPNELCSYSQSDFNIYATARNLLSKTARPCGLLHGLESKLSHDVTTTIRSLLKCCVESCTEKDRFLAANELNQFLKQLLDS